MTVDCPHRIGRSACPAIPDKGAADLTPPQPRRSLPLRLGVLGGSILRLWSPAVDTRRETTKPLPAMKAVVMHQLGAVRVEERDEPRLQGPDEAVVRVTCAGICGSDLHIVSGRDRGCRAGTIMGHEFVGVVEEIGTGVHSLRVGDRVVAPFTVSCGACFYCQRGLTGRCVRSRGFGFVTEEGAGLEGAQAERVHVPLAETTLVRLPDLRADGRPFADREALFLGDILSTAYGCAEGAAIAAGDVVAVVGCGPVGLLCVQAAQLFSPAAVVAVDGLEYRRERARDFGALPAADGTEAAHLVAELTGGRGADAVLEAVGAAGALDLGIRLARPGATVSIAGYHTADSYPLPIQAAYGKNLTFKIGRCHARRYIDVLLPLVLAGRLRHTEIVSHELPLGEGARGYALFAEHRDQAIKVLLVPG
jgi:threonine dehydrogenase-like Zn-dependent dehydrogenase